MPDNLYSGFEGANSLSSGVVSYSAERDALAYDATRGISAEAPKYGNSFELYDYMLLTPSLALADFAATVSSSLGFTDDDALENFLAKQAPRSAQFYRENKLGIQLLGEGAGAMIPGLLATKLITSTTRAGKLLSSVPFLRHMVIDTQRIAGVETAIATERMAMALQGAKGIDILPNPATSALVRQRLKLGLGKAIKENIAAEVGILATMNSAEFLFPEEMEWHDYIPFVAGGLGVSIAFETVAARKIMMDISRRTAKLASDTLNPEKLPVDQLIARPENYDQAITLTRAEIAQSEALKLEGSQAGDRTTLERITNKEIQESWARIFGADRPGQGYFNKLAYQAVPNDVSPRMTPSRSQLENARLALENDPTVFTGTKAIQPFTLKLDKNRTKFVEIMEKRTKRLLKQAENKTGKLKPEEVTKLKVDAIAAGSLANYWKNMEAFVVRNGETAPFTEENILFHDIASNAKIFTAFDTRDPGGFKITEHFDPVGGQRIYQGVDKMLNWGGARGRSIDAIDDFTPYEASANYAIFDRVLRAWGSRVRHPTDERIPVTKADAWMRLDAIDEGIRRGDLRETDLVFEKDFDIMKMRETVLHKKYKDFVKLYSTANYAAKEALLAKGDLKSLVKLKPTTEAEIRYALNLPASEFGQIAPLEELFHAYRAMGMDDISSQTVNDIIEQALLARVSPSGLEFLVRSEVSHEKDQYAKLLRGQNFKPATGTSGDYLEPFSIWRINMEPQKFITRKTLEEDLIYRRQFVNNTIIGNFRDPATGIISGPVGSTAPGVGATSFVASLAVKLRSQAAYKIAQQVQELNQASMRGQSILTQSRFSVRDDPVMQAVHDLNTIADKEAITFKNALYQGKPTETFAKLRAGANESDLYVAGEFFRARAGGWYLKPDAKEIKGVGWSFELDPDSSFNQKRFRELFGRDITKDDVMPRVRDDKKYEALIVPELVMNMAKSFSDVGQRLLLEQNRLLTAMGQPAMRFKQWWVPPRDFHDKHIAYLVADEDGGTFKRMIVANTQQELNELISSAEVKAFRKEYNADVYTADEVKQFHLARGRRFFELMDAGDPIAKGTKASRGSGVSATVTSARQALDDAVTSINSQVDNITRDTIGIEFESQIAYASRANFSQLGQKPQTSIWQQYEDTLLGSRAIRRDHTVGKFYNQIESIVDRRLEAMWDATHGKGIIGTAFNPIKTVLSKMGINSDQKRFDNLKEKLGARLPFEDVSEYMASNFNVKPPPNMKKYMADMNGLVTAITLRMFEFAHPLLNMTGVVTTMPSVTKALRQRTGEQNIEWQGRTALWGSTFDVGTAKIPVFNSVRAMASAIHFAFTKEGQAHLRFASEGGLLRQEVAEIHETMAAPQRTESAWRNFGSKAVEFSSFLSDKSETLARSWAHLTGIMLAKQHGVKDWQNMHTFAHRFANETIGDYRAVNRPVVFQGAVGMPLGLFQTFTWNYYQRLFSYIENKDYRALATQMAMQGTMYGMVTVPGYSLFNDMFVKAMDGQSQPADALQARYGTAVADLMMYGTLSSIPKIFAEDGIALYTRGDVSPRIPAFIDPRQAPIVNLANSVYSIISKVAGQLLPSGQGFSKQATTEILGTYITNRPIRGLFELAAGYSVDRRANVIEDDVRSGISIAARLIGLRTLSEAKSIEVMQRQKLTRLSQLAKMAKLRDAMKAAIRGREVDTPLITNAIQDYVDANGDPRYFPRLMKTLILQATTEKSRVALLKSVKSNTRIEDAMRLINAGVSFQD